MALGPSAIALREKPMRPNLFIVGAPKCGTSSLHYYLQQHPRVFMSNRKELYFFCRDLLSYPPSTSEAEYLKHFETVRNYQWVGESTPWYLFSRMAPLEIRKVAPQSRIIILLRNPVDFLYSLYSQNYHGGQEPLGTFEKALAAEKARLATMPSADSGKLRKEMNQQLYRQAAQFAEQIERFVTIFGRPAVFLGLLDDIKDDPREFFRSLCRWLDISPDVGIDFCPQNANKTWRYPRLTRFLRNPPTAVRLLARTVLSLPLRAKLVNKSLYLNQRFAERISMDPALRRNLIQEFTPEIKRLEILLNRNLKHWLK